MFINSIQAIICIQNELYETAYQYLAKSVS